MKKRTLYGLSVVLSLSAGAALGAPSVAATGGESSQDLVCTQRTAAAVSVPIDTVVKGAAGSKQEVATKTVSNGQYKVLVVGENQESVHPNSNIVVSSDGTSVTVADVESEASGNKTADGTLNVTDGQIQVHVQLGRDQIFSGGVNVELHECVAPEQPKEPEAPVTPEEPEAPAEPEAPEPKQPEEPAAIPATGPAAIISGILGAGSLAGATHAYLRSRRFMN